MFTSKSLLNPSKTLIELPNPKIKTKNFKSKNPKQTPKICRQTTTTQLVKTTHAPPPPTVSGSASPLPLFLHSNSFCISFTCQIRAVSFSFIMLVSKFGI
jgi:hypothetical protein